jgi:hypothetical protein
MPASTVVVQANSVKIAKRTLARRFCVSSTERTAIPFARMMQASMVVLRQFRPGAAR